jgi:hypothetical protein
MSLGQRLPAGNSVDFNRVELPVFAGQEINASQRSMNGGRGAMGEFNERIIRRALQSPRG